MYVFDTNEMMDIKAGKLRNKDIVMTLKLFDFHKLQISSEKFGSELVLPL
jgi:hypothetical protein